MNRQEETKRLLNALKIVYSYSAFSFFLFLSELLMAPTENEKHTVKMLCGIFYTRYKSIR